MTPEQRAVFAGHQKRLAYRMDSAEGTRFVYECKSLGFTEIQILPKRGRQVRTIWHIDGSKITYHSLAEVANVLLRQGVSQRKEKANV